MTPDPISQQVLETVAASHRQPLTIGEVRTKVFMRHGRRYDPQTIRRRIIALHKAGEVYADERIVGADQWNGYRYILVHRKRLAVWGPKTRYYKERVLDA